MITREKAISDIAKLRLRIQFLANSLKETDADLDKLQHDLGLPADHIIYPGQIDAEDRADVLASARADHMKDVAFFGDRSW